VETLLQWLDLIAFGSGVAGIPLAYIGTYRRDLVDRFENWIDSSEGWCEEISDKYCGGFYFQLAFSLCVLVSGLLLYAPLAYYSPVVSVPDLPVIVWAFCIFIVAGALVPLSGYAVATIVRGLNRMTGGHAVDGLGWVLLIVGSSADLLDKILDNT
jgi:hypothetical protein